MYNSSAANSENEIRPIGEIFCPFEIEHARRLRRGHGRNIFILTKGNNLSYPYPRHLTTRQREIDGVTPPTEKSSSTYRQTDRQMSRKTAKYEDKLTENPTEGA